MADSVGALSKLEGATNLKFLSVLMSESSKQQVSFEWLA